MRLCKYVLEAFVDATEIIAVQMYSSTNESKLGNKKPNKDKDNNKTLL
jgi:hypothetical protein